MAQSLQLTIDNKDLLRAMQKGPDILRQELNRSLGRSVQEMAVQARNNAPRAHSVLTNSIMARQAGDLVYELVSGTAYGRMVEEGTDSGGFPSEQTILDWIKDKGINPHDPDMSREDLAYVMARSIALRGTPAQPHMVPAFESKKARAEYRLNKAVDRTLQRMGK